MASRASTSRWFFRDLPRGYVVIALSAGVVAVLAFGFDRSSSPPPAAAAVAQPTKAELDKRYRGAIIFPTDQEGICLTVTLDNRTGKLGGGGYGKCEQDRPRRVAKESDELARLRALGSAFRH